MSSLLSLSLFPVTAMVAPSAGYDLDRFAGRYALGKNLPVVDRKQGFSFNRPDGGVRVLGGACSEVLGGANLANLLRSGHELEVRAMAALEKGEAAEVLSIHTSAGVPPQLDDFMTALEPHLPKWAREGDDWCVNLQAEGGSAVHAAIDMALQVFQEGQDFNRRDARTLVACGASSYHGPASTSPGGGTPLGARAKGLTHPARYPVPSPFLRRRGEDDASFHGRMLTDFKKYLDTYEHELGVLLIEPQWGSSVAGMPWPPLLIQAYIAEAKSRGIAVVCDEIMCGLGRHGGQATPGGTGCFLTECWDLEPDIVTFGKSIGGGAGHLLSGAILLRGAKKLAMGSRTAFQSHTYAGSSARALANGAALLNQLTAWTPSVRKIGETIAPIAAELNEASGGAVMAHGMGALWGGLFAHADPAARTAANLDFKKRCAEARVLPYFVPVGGFMLTPRYDDDPEILGAAVKDMAQCALESTRAMGWAPSALLPIDGPVPVAKPPTERVAPKEASSGGLTAREASIIDLAVAYTYRSAGQWSSSVAEARANGLENGYIASLAKGAVPPLSGKDLAVYVIAADLLEYRRVSADHYDMGVAAFGEAGVAEVTSLIGASITKALASVTFEVAGADKNPWDADAAAVSDDELKALMVKANEAKAAVKA